MMRLDRPLVHEQYCDTVALLPTNHANVESMNVWNDFSIGLTLETVPSVKVPIYSLS